MFFSKAVKTKLFQDMKEQCLIKGSGRSKWELGLEVVLGTKFSPKTDSQRKKRNILYKFYIISFPVVQQSLVLWFSVFLIVYSSELHSVWPKIDAPLLSQFCVTKCTELNWPCVHWVPPMCQAGGWVLTLLFLATTLGFLPCAQPPSGIPYQSKASGSQI